jgi:predicted DNA-binding protein
MAKKDTSQAVTSTAHEAADDLGAPTSAGSDEQMVMASFRITKSQAKALDLVSELTGRTKTEVVREAISEKIARLASTESIEEMTVVYRQRLTEQAELLERSLARF